jgi:regulator of sigma E protease
MEKMDSMFGSKLVVAKRVFYQAEQGFNEFIRLTALLSINLGLINLLPIPVLDGGHIFFFLISHLLQISMPC